MRVSTLLLIPFLSFMLVLGAWLSPLPAQDDDIMMEDKGVMDILDDIQNDAVTTWWNKDWKYRRRIVIEDPRLLNLDDQAILLEEPDALLLYNTRECAPKMADVRVIDAAGKPLPAGVTNFGRDDGSSRIWVKAQGRANLRSLQLFLYYGNAQGKPQNAEYPEGGGLEGDAQFVQIGAEEIVEGGTAPPLGSGAFFKDTVATEAEAFKSDDERLAREEMRWTASGEAFMVWKKDAARDKPAVLRQTVALPAAGAWKMHVRFRTPTRKGEYQPFAVVINDKEYAAGTADVTKDGPAFAWTSHEMQLPAGNINLALRLTGPAAPDCILLSRDARYVPDYRDINGPVWFRARAADPAGKELPPFYIDLFGMHTTYSVNGMQGNTAAYLLKDRVIFPKKTQMKTDNGGVLLFNDIPPYVVEMVKKPENLLQAGQWSPWGRGIDRGSYTWFTEIRYVPGGKNAPRDLGNVKAGYEFATRPDISRIFRAGEEETGPGQPLFVHMHPSLDLATVRKDTVTFLDWAKQRFAVAESLGFKGGEGPKKIIMGSMGGAKSPAEGEMVAKTFDWLGVNTLTFYAGPGTKVGEVLERNNVTGLWDYHRSEYMGLTKYFTREVPGEFTETVTGKKEPVRRPIDKPAGTTFDAFVEKTLNTNIDKYYRESIEGLKKRDPWSWAHTVYNDLDDEIGAAITSHDINRHPVFKGQFVEYLEKHGLKPDFFGKKNWDEVKAIDYTPALSAKEERTEQIKKDVEAAEERLDDLMTGEGGGLDDGPPATLEDPVKEANEKKKAEEERREKERLGLVEKEPAGLQEKRIYTWTQRFRSYFTAMFYRQATEAVHKYFPPGIRTCANLQASPITSGNMWDGSLNVFELGRLKAFSSMQVEDWHNSPVNVRFGMNMMSASARKQNLTTTALVVGHRQGQRIITNLMEGSHIMYFYLYGPIYNIGPSWAEDKPTLQDLGTALRQVARVESDVLAAKGRPREAAVLLANSSEINGYYHETCFDNERMSVYAALWDAQVPTDLVGEEEIIEDNALARYKVLYVCDPHVDARTAAKIKEWVRGGGVLWADYDAMARNEYDEPLKSMDEVLGLKTRPEIVPYTTRPWSGKLPEGLTVKVAANNGVVAQEITGVRFSPQEKSARSRPDLAVGEGKVVATFADGKPAALHNTFGKGQVWFYAFPAALAYSNHYEPHGYNFARVARETPATPARGTLFTAAAQAAGAATQLKVDQHMLFTDVHDGPAQTVVYLVNMGQDMKAKPLEVKVPRQPKTASLASGSKVDFTFANGVAKVPLTLAAEGYDILVFKY